jgi:hypothetical protein
MIQVEYNMVMEPTEQPFKRNRSIKSGRVPIKQGGELNQGGTGPPRQDLRAENSRTGFWNIELRAEIVPD